MTIELPHFDTRLKLYSNNSEKLEHTVAEYLFPKQRWAIGDVEKENCRPEHLRPFDGLSLQFSSRHRMFYGASQVAPLLYPNLSDRTAYGSLPFTSNRSFNELRAKILVIDDGTGENGGILPPELARRLVGDCYGKLSYELAERLTEVNDTPFQFRIGIKPQQGNEVYRIAKGTLAPDPRIGDSGIDILDWSRSWATQRWLETANKRERELLADYFSSNRRSDIRTVLSQLDMVLATSSFKGRKGAEAIKPGVYELDVGIGVKTLAEYGPHSLGTQILVNYPNAVQKELLELVAKRSRYLAIISQDPYVAAQAWVEDYKRRQEFYDSLKRDYEPGELELDYLKAIDEAMGWESSAIEPERSRQKVMYDLLTKDLEHHGQLVEMPFFVEEFSRWTKNKWLEAATGREIKFTSGLAQPSLDLAKDEVCVPYLRDGEELIVTRSPLVNANGVRTLTNRHIPYLMRIKGTIHIHPETAAKYLQADFDGDRLAFERASKYPVLAAEIEELNCPENAYPDVSKLDKIPYTGSFEEIAASAVRLDIGKYANQIQRFVSLRTEVHRVPETEIRNYLGKMGGHFSKLLANNGGELSFPESLTQMAQAESPDGNYLRRAMAEVKRDVKILAAIARHFGSLTPEQVADSRQRTDRIMYHMVGFLQNQLQVAVDGPKSARRPDESIYELGKAIASYKKVEWLEAKKDPQMYQNKLFPISGCSAIDMMASQTNRHFQDSRLQARQSDQFRTFFPEPTPESLEIAREVRDTYNALLKEAGRLRDLSDDDKELAKPHLAVTSAKSGRTIYVTNIAEALEGKRHILEKGSLDITLRHNPNGHSPNQLQAIGQDTEGEITIGTVSERSREMFKLRPGMTLTGAAVSYQPGIDEAIVKDFYSRADQFRQELQQQYADSQQRQQLVAALWHASFPRKGEESHRYVKGNLALTLFPEDVAKQLETLQFDRLRVWGAQYDTNQYRGIVWQGETVPVEIRQVQIPGKAGKTDSKRSLFIDGELLAPLSDQSPQLPVGTKAQASLHSLPPASVNLVTQAGLKLTVKEVSRNAYRERLWQGERASIVIRPTLNRQTQSQEFPAYVEGMPLGKLNPTSTRQLANRGVSLSRPITFTAKLYSEVKAIDIQLHPQTVSSTWKDRYERIKSDLELDPIRKQYRQMYLSYVGQIKADPQFKGNPNSREDIDLEVAEQVYLNTGSQKEVAMVLSQSDQVREWKMTLPEMDEYQARGKEYVAKVRDEGIAHARQRQEVRRGMER